MAPLWLQQFQVHTADIVENNFENYAGNNFVNRVYQCLHIAAGRMEEMHIGCC